MWTCDICGREFKNRNQSHSCKKVHTVDEYITLFSSKHQNKLIVLREIIKQTVPDVVEQMKWNMPTFIKNGGNLVHFAMQKNHIGFHVGTTTVEAFKDELANFYFSKGTIHLPNDQPLPQNLIEKIVQFRVERLANK